MFNIPFRCYDCKENLVGPVGEGRSVKLKCECILGWCQECARKSLLECNNQRNIIGEKSFLVCPICEDKVSANDIVSREKADENGRIRIEEIKFNRNIFLENCIKEELSGERGIERNCVVCMDSFVEGNTVQQFCSCTVFVCQLCVREHISRHPYTFSDGDSYNCLCCRFKTPNLQNVKEARSKEVKLLEEACMKFFIQGRSAKVNMKLRKNLVLLWAGIVYLKDSQIGALDTVRRKINPKEKVPIGEVVLLLEAELNAPLKPLLKFTLDVESATTDMLRLDISRLFLWRKYGGPVMPFGPLAVLTIPRNRLLERWALKKMDESRDSTGAMEIISTSDYYAIEESNNNKTRIVGKTWKSEMNAIFAVQVLKKIVVPKEEAYLSTYCQGPIQSVLPVTRPRHTARINQPIIDMASEEDEEDADDDEEVNIDTSHGEINQSGDMDDTEYEVIDLLHDEDNAAADFDDAFQDNIVSPPTVSMFKDYNAGDAAATVAEDWMDHMIVEAAASTLNNTASSSESPAESSSSHSITHSLAHSISSQSPNAAGISAEENDADNGGMVEQAIHNEVRDQRSSAAVLKSHSSVSTGLLGDRPSAPPVIVAPAKKTLLQSFAHSRGWNALKRTSVVCLDDRMETSTSIGAPDALKRSRVTTTPATSLVASMQHNSAAVVVSSSSISILSPTSSTAIRSTKTMRNPMIASQLNDSDDATAATALSTHASISVNPTTTSNTTTITTTTATAPIAEPKPKVKKSVTFKKDLEEFEPDRPKVFHHGDKKRNKIQFHPTAIPSDRNRYRKGGRGRDHRDRKRKRRQ